VDLAAEKLHLGLKRLLAFRFTNVTIPRSAVITSAVLKLYVAGDEGEAVMVRYIGGEGQ
jgi:hypothetical protein